MPSPDVFTDYTDTNGSWIILDGDGEYEDNGVWSRCVRRAGGNANK